MDNIAPVKDNNVLLNANADNHSSNKLLLEASLLGGGIKDGFLARKDEALKNPGVTALEFAGAAAIGAGITLANEAGGKWGVAARVASKALGYVAIADGVRRLAPTGYAMYDTFVNPGNYDDNRATVAKYLGSACFDYPLMAAGGMLGSSAAHYGPRAASSMMNRFRANAEGVPTNTDIKAALEAASRPVPKHELFQGNDGAKPTSKGWNEAELTKVDTRKLIDSIKPTDIAIRNNPAKTAVETGAKDINAAKLSETFKPTPEQLRVIEAINRMGMNSPVKPEIGAVSPPKDFGNARNTIPQKFDLPKFEIDPKNMILNPPKFEIPNLIESRIYTRTSVIPIIPLPLSDHEKLELKKVQN